MFERVRIWWMSVFWLATVSCASFDAMQTSKNLPEKFLVDCQRLHFAPTKYVLTVNISRQLATLFADGQWAREIRCSTSRFGIGEIKNSNCTPRGLHRIAEKIGAGEPAGTVFSSRKIIGHVSELGVAKSGITTRIMWLDGLEPGFNSGGDVDTHGRYIYLHGTGDQESIGQPASHGCVHFADADLVELFDLLPSGTLVWITEK